MARTTDGRQSLLSRGPRLLQVDTMSTTCGTNGVKLCVCVWVCVCKTPLLSTAPLARAELQRQGPPSPGLCIGVALR